MLREDHMPRSEDARVVLAPLEQRAGHQDALPPSSKGQVARAYAQARAAHRPALEFSIYLVCLVYIEYIWLHISISILI